MRYLMIAALGIGAIFAADLCAKPQMVHLGDLTQKVMEDFIEGKHENMVVICPEGMVLPLTFSVKGEFLALQSSEAPAQVKILKTCFVKCVGKVFFFSLNGEHWRDFSEFFTGKLGASLGVGEQGAFAGVDCELYQRN